MDQAGGLVRLSRRPAAHRQEGTFCYAPFPPAGVGIDGAVLLRSVTARVSTADSTLTVGQGLSRQYPYGRAGFKPDGDSYVSIMIS